MAKMVSNLVLRVRPGPAVQGVLDLLRLTTEAIELIPDWHTQEREELTEKLNVLGQMLPYCLMVETEQ